MRIYEERAVDLESGADLMREDAKNNVIALDKYLNKSSRDAYDDFLDVIMDEFMAVDQYIPVNTEHLFGQIPTSVELLFNSDDRLYKKMIKSANHIEPFMINVMNRTPESQKNKIGPVSGLVEAIMSRYTDINIPINKNTEWIDKFLRDCFPETLKLMTRTKPGKMIFRESWINAMNSDLILNKGVDSKFIEFAYLSMVMILEQILFINNPNRDQINIVYGPEGSYDTDLIYLSLGGILMTEFESLDFEISPNDTPLDIVSNLYNGGERFNHLYMISKYAISYLSNIYDDGFYKLLMSPIGEYKFELFNGYKDSVEGLNVLFNSYIKDIIDSKNEDIRFLTLKLKSSSKLDSHIEYQDKQIELLEKDIDKYLDEIESKDKNLIRLNKIVGKYQADENRNQLLIDENKYLKKLITSYEESMNKSNVDSNESDDIDEEFIKNWIKNKKIAIVGGDINWQKRIKETIDSNIIFYHPENGNQSLEKLNNVDLIFINTHQLSHDLYNRISKYLNNNYHFINSSSSNLKMFFREVYNASKYN